MNVLAPMDTEALLARLQALHAQVMAIGYPRGEDLVGRELGLIDRALRRLLRELGERDGVDP
ncbi:MAG: hypothetical protein IT368_12705 [Candidatus Hydrogenedentes bacterium]|nr:hypothetical protein [Candidatus Hydrogenedentota bacterium]